tara:strand:- start:2121 stop:2522 length:402 start_codon:yes stop_codon:yes gene_type:complete
MDSRTANKYGPENNSSVIELTEQDFNGIQLISPKIKGKYCLLKIYAPWCGYCVRMTKDMNFLGNSLKKRDIPVASINFEQNKELVGRIGSRGFPSMFVVDRSGKLNEVNMGSRSVLEMLKGLQKSIKTLEMSG